MRRRTAFLLLAVVAVFPLATAQAQAPDTTPPAVSLKLLPGTTGQLIQTGLSYRLQPNEEVTFTARATMRSKGKTVLVSKSIRTEQNYGQAEAEYTLIATSERVAKILRKAKKAVPITLTVTGKDTAGNAFSKVATAKFKKG